MAVLVCASEDSVSKRWRGMLDELSLPYYDKKSKSEIFDYLNTHKTPTLLMLEAGFIDSEEFLALISRSYPWVKIIMLSSYPCLKEACGYLKHGVRGYGNCFCNFAFIKDAFRMIEDDGYWYYPEFLQAFNGDELEETKSIGEIKSVQNLLLIKSHNIEKEALVHDKLYLHDEVILEENSKAVLHVGMEEIDLNGKKRVMLDLSTFNEKFGLKYCYFSESDRDEILTFFKNKNSTKRKIKDSKNDKLIARYTGKRDEYEIFPSKNLNTFFVVKDKIDNRDGSDLIGRGIEKLIFADIEIVYDNL